MGILVKPIVTSNINKVDNNRRSNFNNKRVSISFNKENQLSFGATFWKYVKDGTAAGGAAGGTVGLNVDVYTAGHTLGVPTAVGTIGGGAVGAIGGGIKYFVDKHAEKKLAAIARENERIRREKEELEKREGLFKKQQKAADERTRVEMQAMEQQIAEIRRRNEISELYNAQAWQEVKGFGLGRIAGYLDDKKALNEAFLSPFIKSMKDSTDSGVCREVPNGVLLYGLTGNGKTTMALALAEQALGEKMNSNFHNLEGDAEIIIKNLQEIKKQASEEFGSTQQRTIVFIDEFDGIALKDDKVGYDANNNRQLKSFLNDCSDYGVTVIAATNHPQNIEEAFIKNKKRFKVQTVIEPPSKEDTEAILNYYLQGVSGETVQCKELADEIDKKANEGKGRYTCSAVESIAAEAKKSGKRLTRLVSQADLLSIIEDSGPDLSKKSLEKFNSDFEYMSNGITYEEYLARKKSS